MNKPIILLTGAGRPTGQAIAAALAAHGAIIAAVDVNPLGLEACLKAVTAAGGQAKDYVFDATKRLPVVGLVQSVIDDWGRIDVLINAAEVDPKDSFLLLDEWDFHRALEVNVAGPFLLIQRVGQVMREQERGLIINLGIDSAAKGLAYQVGKAALLSLTQAAAQELSPFGIQVLWVEQGEKMLKKISAQVAGLNVES